MTRKLLILFAGAGLLALALLAIAWLTSGAAFVRDIGRDHGWSFTFSDDDDDAGPRVTRSFAYDGSRPLTLDVPVELRFRRGTDATMTVAGSREMMAALRWRDGRLSVSPGLRARHTLHVTVVAPQLAGVVLNGAGDVDLGGLDQPALALTVNGSGDFTAEGRVGRVDVVASGVGDVDLAKLAVNDATVRASGVGDVTVSAVGNVDVDISGVGGVTLKRKPANLVSHVSGIGAVDRDY